MVRFKKKLIFVIYVHITIHFSIVWGADTTGYGKMSLEITHLGIFSKVTPRSQYDFLNPYELLLTINHNLYDASL
ncbi:MAG: hypothetical protein JJT94_16655 [Bernardetiaceae bacterium]|nr:hypothetical protein [Bernardetiaceae bacterium]